MFSTNTPEPILEEDEHHAVAENTRWAPALETIPEAFILEPRPEDLEKIDTDCMEEKDWLRLETQMAKDSNLEFERLLNCEMKFYEIDHFLKFRGLDHILSQQQCQELLR